MRDAAGARAVGILPALGGGLTDLARGGQHERLLGLDLRHYAEAYDIVYYFSYFREVLADFTRDPLLLEKVTLLPRRGPWPSRLYALLLPLVYRREFRRCEVLRVMQFPGVIPALVARTLFGTPYVVTYGYHYAEVARIAGSRWKPRLLGLLERVALPRAAGVIVTSTEMQAELVARRPLARILHVPNGVDTVSFAPAPPSAATPPGRSVLYVGRLEREKNLERLIDALALVRPDPVRLSVVGTGSCRADLERRAATRGVSVAFEGVAPHSRLPAHFAAAAAFVLPSLTEGHPKALIEAMACGVPCAVSARGGNLSLVEDGVTGLLFDPENVADMARAIDRLLTDRPLARRLAEAARAAIVARYDAHALLRHEVRLVAQAALGEPLGGLFEHYAETAPMGESIPEFLEPRLRALLRRPPRAVLDLGAGDGRYLDLFRASLPADSLVVGCEISLRRAARIKAKGFGVVVAQAEALPFREGAFDLVTLMEVIEHTRSPARTLDEVRRVLRAGGRLALTTPNYPVKRLYDVRAAVRLADIRRLRDDPTHLSPLSARRLERLLAARFESVALEGTALLGESRSRWVRTLKGSPLGRRLSHKLFALCAKGS